MSFDNWTIEDLFTRCMDCDDMTLEMDKEEFAALRRKIAELQNRGAIQSGNSGQVPAGLRLALSNAGIAAPESDDMLFATHEKYVQLLIDWVKDRKPFSSPKAPAGLVAAVNRLLDSDGSRGSYSAIRCYDAREEIERLLAAAPVASDGWIPVSERLPVNVNTVVTSNGADIGHGWWDGERWFEDDPVPEGITHWQPLPDAPKGV